MSKWKLINNKHPNESASIELSRSGLFHTTYISEYGGRYGDYTKTLKGAKISLSRYLGYKTEWKEI